MAKQCPIRRRKGTSKTPQDGMHKQKGPLWKEGGGIWPRGRVLGH